VIRIVWQQNDIFARDPQQAIPAVQKDRIAFADGKQFQPVGVDCASALDGVQDGMSKIARFLFGQEYFMGLASKAIFPRLAKDSIFPGVPLLLHTDDLGELSLKQIGIGRNREFLVASPVFFIGPRSVC
jgi:hypothetical protein